MGRTTVIVGFAEAMAAPEVVWSLVDAGFRVVAFARKGRPSALRHSRHVECHEVCAPESDLETSRANVEAILASTKSTDGAQQMLFPLDDKAVWLCSKLTLPNGWFLAGPSGPNAELALNKYLQVQAAMEAGFNVPDTALAKTASDVRAFAMDRSFPIIMKPAECVPIWQGRAQSCRKWICANRAELDRALGEWSERVPLLVQPFITGTGEGLFGLAAPDGVRAWSAHRRLRMMNPQGSGSSACISQTVSEDLKVASEELVHRAEWRGVFMVELLRDKAGKVWFVELNGRPWGSMALSRNQGLEYPAWHVTLAMNQESPVGLAKSPSPGLICRHVGREFMHFLFVLKGAKSDALQNWPPLGQTILKVFGIHRGDTYYNWRSDDSKVFFADFYYTIHDNVFKTKHS